MHKMKYSYCFQIDKEWVYRTTLMKDKKQALAEVQAKMYKQTYCPGKRVSMFCSNRV